MPDDKNEAPEKVEGSDKTAVKTPDAAVQEAKEGKKDLSKSVSDYYQARKDGLRDKYTQENLPPQPEFFDSAAKDAGKPLLASTKGLADNQLGDAATTTASGTAADLAKKIGDTASDIEKKVSDGIKDTGKKIVDDVKDSTKKLADTAADIEKKVEDGIKDTAKKVVDDLKDTGKKIGDGATEVGKKISEGASELGKKIHEEYGGGTAPRLDKVTEAAQEKQRIDEMAADKGKNAEKDKLNKSLDAHTPPISEEKKAEFRKNMEDFEKRSAQRGLPPEEVAKTYAELGKILDAKGDSPMKPEQREKIAEQVMDHAAHPTDINQGYHQTCNVTVVESMMYTKNPAAAAHMMSEISTKGEYTGQDGTHVKLNPANFSPDSEAKKDPPGSGDRNYASQMFQVTAANLELQKHHPDQEYVQRPVPLSGKTLDSGEQIIDKATGNVVKDGDKPRDMAGGFSTEKVAETYNMIADKDPKTGKAEHFDVGLTCPPFSDQPVHATGIDSQEKLDTKLAELKKDNKLPTAVWVHTSAEPFWTDSGGGSAGGAGGDKGGGHYVTVTDYDAGPPAKVAIDNQWGKSADHQWKNPDGSIDTSKGINSHDLFIAMHDPKDQVDLLKKDVEANRRDGKIDTGKELDYLRMQRMTDQISNDDYAKQVNKTMTDADARWKEQKDHKPPTFDQDEHDRAGEKVKQAIRFLPPSDRMKVLETAAGSDLLTPDYKKEMIEKTVGSLLKDKADKISNGKFSTADRTDYAKYNEELKAALAKLPKDQQDEILKVIAAKAPSGAPQLDQ